MNEYLILRGEGFNRCLVRCGGPMNTSGVSTLICDTPPFVRRFFKPDNPERTSIPCDLGRSYFCYAFGSGDDCVANPYLGGDLMDSDGVFWIVRMPASTP